MFVLQIKCKSYKFLNIYIHSAKNENFFDHKKYICSNFVVKSIIWSLEFRKHPICGII